MSVLETPRFYFKGEVSWDPIVTNNDPQHYDEATAEPVFSTAADKVAAFRKQAIADVTQGGNWNPHGTHRATFFNSTVTGFDAGAGDASKDPFVGASAWLTGMLVDLEPYGASSSQIFFDRVSFGVEGGYSLIAPRRTRFTGRYINFARNSDNTMIAGVGSIVWQTSFAKADGLTVGAHDSPFLQTLKGALDQPGVLGLTLRFNAYRTIYFDDPTLRNGSAATQAAAVALAAKLGAGGFQPNPARSLIVGVVGLWRDGETTSEPSERVLRPAGAQPPIAGAFARIDGQRLTLDLANSIPETDANLTKLDLGPLTVAAVDAAGKDVAVIGALPYAQYDRAAYERAAGIVTLPLTQQSAKAASENDLVLRQADGTVLAAEARLRAIPQTPNLYRDEGQATNAGFQLYEHGEPLRKITPVEIYTLDANGAPVGQPQSINSDATGRLDVSVPASGGAILTLVPSLGGDPAPNGGVDPQTYTYMYIRTLPADADIAALAPTWKNVFARVLANWAAMAPCMDNWLPLDDEAQVKARKAMLKRLTDPAHFEEFRFMPVVRDMTAGERTLLYKFLDAPPVAAVAMAEIEAKDFTKLSRAMRRGALSG
jgi:hypothetical protein